MESPCPRARLRTGTWTRSRSRSWCLRGRMGAMLFSPRLTHRRIPTAPRDPLMEITCTLRHCNSSAVLRLLQVLVRRLRVWDVYPTGTRTPLCTDGVLPKPCHVAHGEQRPSASSHASLLDNNTLLPRAPFNLRLLSTVERHHPVACNHH